MGRPGLQDRVRNALRDRGAQLLIYGDTGVGKSTVLQYSADENHKQLVAARCLSDRSYEDLLQICLSRLITFSQVGFSDSTTVSAESGGTVDAKLISVTGKTKTEYGTEREFKVVRQEPIYALIDAMKATSHDVIVLDNFQNVEKKRDRKLVAQTMELLADSVSETDNIKLVVIGIADDAAELLSLQPSYNRRVVEIEVPRMPDDEIRQVLRTGFGLLGLESDSRMIEQLVFFSDGFPYFAHLLGLEIARAARTRKQSHITTDMLEVGLEAAASEVDQSYKERIRQAMEAGGEVQPRRRILELLAFSPAREWTVKEVADLFEAKVAHRDDWSFLAAALAALTLPKHGSVLKRSGTAGKYLYKFREPHLRPYLRIAVFPKLRPAVS